MSGMRRALKIQAVTDPHELRHDGVECICEIILLSRIGSAGRPSVRGGQGRRCAGARS
jgi:hypothetical protein